MFAVRKVVVHEMQQKITAFTIITGVHRYFSEKIADLRIDDYQGAQPIPDIVQSKKPLARIYRWLKVGLYPAAPQFNRVRQVVRNETIRKIKIMMGGKRNFSGVQHRILAFDVAIPTNNFFILGRPDNELIVTHGVGIVCVEVETVP